MNTKNLEYFKSVLTDELDQLFARAGQTVSMLAKPQGNEAELIDRASSQAEQAFNLRIRDRESFLINKIKEALQRIEDNEFGVCELCGEDIFLGRLKARPVTTKCIKCKESEEKEELRRSV